MKGAVLFIVGILLLLLIGLSFLSTTKEGFMSSFNIGTRMQCPTRNQSYDLRGEAAILPRTEMPINNSGFGPLNPNDCPRNSVEIL